MKNMKKVIVSLRAGRSSSYGILIKRGLSRGLASKIARDMHASSYCIITDSRVEKVFGRKLLAQFRKAGEKARMLAFPVGEKSKGMRTVEKMIGGMLASGADRKSCVVALGGGVVGDVAGFCAAVYMRGIRCVQVPTTLLAMVDSSVGGKTGVDMPLAKNSVGAFLQPEAVYICPELLRSLPEKELRNGLAEVVKHAVIADAKLFAYLERNHGEMLSVKSSAIERVIARSCGIKARVVMEDERESNLRRTLNFGHTIGHALETLGNYARLGHGEAVSIGMAVEAEISCALGIMPRRDAARLIRLLSRIGLPVKVRGYRASDILRAARRDKKAVSGKVLYSLPRRIGVMHSVKGRYGTLVPDRVAARAIRVCA